MVLSVSALTISCICGNTQIIVFQFYLFFVSVVEHRESLWASELDAPVFQFNFNIILFPLILFLPFSFVFIFLFLFIYSFFLLVSFFLTRLFSPLRPLWLIAVLALSIGVAVWNLIIIIIK